MRAARAAPVHMPAGSIRLLSRVAEHQLAPDEHAHDAAPRARANRPQTRPSALRRLPRRGARPPCSWAWRRCYWGAARWRRERQSAPQPPGHLSCRRTPPGRRAAGCCWSIRAAGAGVGGGLVPPPPPLEAAADAPSRGRRRHGLRAHAERKGPLAPPGARSNWAPRRSPPPRSTAKRQRPQAVCCAQELSCRRTVTAQHRTSCAARLPPTCIE